MLDQARLGRDEGGMFYQELIDGIESRGLQDGFLSEGSYLPRCSITALSLGRGRTQVGTMAGIAATGWGWDGVGMVA